MYTYIQNRIRGQKRAKEERGKREEGGEGSRAFRSENETKSRRKRWKSWKHRCHKEAQTLSNQALKPSILSSLLSPLIPILFYLPYSLFIPLLTKLNISCLRRRFPSPHSTFSIPFSALLPFYQSLSLSGSLGCISRILFLYGSHLYGPFSGRQPPNYGSAGTLLFWKAPGLGRED